MTTITLKIEASELATAIGALAAAITAVPAAAEAPAAAGKASTPARSAAKASTPEASPEPTPQTDLEPSSTEASPSTEPTADAGTASTEISYDVVRKAVLDLTAKRGRDAAVACLGQFENADGGPVANGKELKPADYEDFLNAAQALIDGELA